MKFGDYPGAIWDIRKAKVEVDETRLRFPSFQANIKPLALLECLFGSIPDQFKWGGSLFGLEGDVKMGLNMYEKLLSQSSFETSFFAEEIKLTHALVLFREINHYLASGEILPAPRIHEIQAILNEHLLDHYAFYGEYTGLRTARKHIAWYCKGLRNSHAFRHLMNSAEDCKTQLQLVNDYFDEMKLHSDHLLFLEAA